VFDSDENQPKSVRLSLSDLPLEWRDWAIKERTSLDPGRMWSIFRDHYHAAIGDKALSADWFAVWRNWVRRERVADGGHKTGATADTGNDHRPEYTKGATPIEDIPWMH